MALPEPVLDYPNRSARSAGARTPKETGDLFKTGVLDSFALVDFLAVSEEHAGIKASDSDVNPSNSQTIEAIERYAEGRKGQGA